MKKFAIAAAFAVTASTSFAGTIDEPIVEPEIIIEETETSSSSGGIVIPLLLLAVVAAAAS